VVHDHYKVMLLGQMLGYYFSIAVLKKSEVSVFSVTDIYRIRECTLCFDLGTEWPNIL